MKTNELLKKIWKYQDPVCQHLGSASPKVIQNFRNQHGEGGFRACSFALLWEVNKKYHNFDLFEKEFTIDAKWHDSKKKKLG